VPNEPCVVAVQLFDKLEQLKNMETKEEKRENLVEFLFENSACLNCIAVYYCGSFISKDDCLKCIDDGLQELLQHNVSNSAFYNLIEWILKNKRSCFIDADISKDDKREILRKLNYSSNMLDE
jgi:hypothetical protein